MQSFIPRFAYYQRLNQHMKMRKTLERENRKIKKKLMNHYVSLIPLWQTRIIENKKKSIFFMLCCGLFFYYDGHNFVQNKWKQMEPFSLKFRRWIFKEKNILPDSIKEFKIKNSNLKSETIDQLKTVYIKYEEELSFGISRKFMFEVYDHLKLFQKEEEKVGFYRQSGYYKKRNQKIQSVHFQQFVTIFEDALKKLHKGGNQITESDLLEQFIQICQEKENEIKLWEIKTNKKRAEYIKLLPELQDQKEAFIRQLLSENPYAKEEEIDQELKSKGLYGLGTKDKLILYDLQLTLHKLLLDSKLTKLSGNQMFGQSTLSQIKEKKLKDKIELYEKKIKDIQELRDQMADKFKVLFKKQEIFDI